MEPIDRGAFRFRRATPTATPARRELLEEGTEGALLRPARRICVPQPRRPTAGLRPYMAVQLPGRQRDTMTKRRTCGVCARRGRARELRFLILATGASLDSDLPRLEGMERSGPIVHTSTGRTSQSTWRASASRQSAPERKAPGVARSPTRWASSPCSSAGRTGAPPLNKGPISDAEMAEIRRATDEISPPAPAPPGASSTSPTAAASSR